MAFKKSNVGVEIDNNLHFEEGDTLVITIKKKDGSVRKFVDVKHTDGIFLSALTEEGSGVVSNRFTHIGSGIEIDDVLEAVGSSLIYPVLENYFPTMPDGSRVPRLSSQSEALEAAVRVNDVKEECVKLMSEVVMASFASFLKEATVDRVIIDLFGALPSTANDLFKLRGAVDLALDYITNISNDGEIAVSNLGEVSRYVKAAMFHRSHDDVKDSVMRDMPEKAYKELVNLAGKIALFEADRDRTGVAVVSQDNVVSLFRS